MFKKLLLLAALLTGALLAQNVTVSGTVANADGTPLSGGVITATLTNSAGMTYDQLPYNAQTANIPVQQASTILDGNGSFTLGLESNTQVTGSFWTFTVCSPNSNASCTSVIQSITGNVSLSGVLNMAINNGANPKGRATVADVQGGKILRSLPTTGGLTGTGFPWKTPPAHLYSAPQIGGTYVDSTDFDITQYDVCKTSSYAYYVDPINGLDSNVGYRPNAPFQSISKAITVGSTNCPRIYLIGSTTTPAWFPLSLGFNTSFGAQNPFSMYALNGADTVFISSNIALPTFTLVSAHYEGAVTTSVNQVFDTSARETNFASKFGLYSQLTQVASSALVDSTPGTFFWAANVLYVHLFDSRAPDASVKVDVVGGFALNETWPIQMFFRDVNFIGGDGPIQVIPSSGPRTTQSPILAMQRGRVNQASSASGQAIYMGGDATATTHGQVYLDSVQSVENVNDGVSCAASASTDANAVYFLENNVQAGWNINYSTVVTSSTSNSSTMHFYCYALRIGGDRENTNGPVIGDGGLGGHSLNFNVTFAHNLQAANPATLSNSPDGFIWVYDSVISSIGNTGPNFGFGGVGQFYIGGSIQTCNNLPGQGYSFVATSTAGNSTLQNVTPSGLGALTNGMFIGTAQASVVGFASSYVQTVAPTTILLSGAAGGVSGTYPFVSSFCSANTSSTLLIPFTM